MSGERFNLKDSSIPGRVLDFYALDDRCFVYLDGGRELLGTLDMSAEDALRLADWLIDTFGEAVFVEVNG